LSSIFCRADPPNFRGNNQTTTKGGNRGDKICITARVLLKPFSCSQERQGQRLVINLKALNSFVNKEHFKMEGIHTLKDLLRQGDWLAKIDLKDALFSIPFTEATKAPQVYLQREDLPIQLPLSSTPWVFTKTLKSALAIQECTADSLHR